MEVLVGATFGIDVRDRNGVVPTATDQHVVAPCLFLKDDIGRTRDDNGSVFGIGLPGKAPASEEDSSESSSSIGAPDESEDEDDDVSSKDAQSNLNGAGLGSLGSLEDSLPIK